MFSLPTKHPLWPSCQILSGKKQCLSSENQSQWLRGQLSGKVPCIPFEIIVKVFWWRQYNRPYVVGLSAGWSFVLSCSCTVPAGALWLWLHFMYFYSCEDNTKNRMHCQYFFLTFSKNLSKLNTCNHHGLSVFNTVFLKISDGG